MRDGVISAWRGISEANSPFKLVASLRGHAKSVVCLTVGCLNKRLFSGSMDHSIKVWDLDTFESKMTVNEHSVVNSNQKHTNKTLTSVWGKTNKATNNKDGYPSNNNINQS
ncbi:zinc finger CCCH domain-containing protein [Trifolium repens]|nr:zinc finger CCCH domain-containing protein [Trifolium repens]